jgi:ATP synthase F1 complex assembly factor 2
MDGKSEYEADPAFWVQVSQLTSADCLKGALQVHLDERPLRHPATKEIVRLPVTKGYLAAALALEWDHLTSTQEAARQHLIPLTSLVCRVIDIQADDASDSPEASKIRTAIATTVMKYLDTDSLLLGTTRWALRPEE